MQKFKEKQELPKTTKLLKSRSFEETRNENLSNIASKSTLWKTGPERFWMLFFAFVVFFFVPIVFSLCLDCVGGRVSRGLRPLGHKAREANAVDAC